MKTDIDYNKLFSFIKSNFYYIIILILGLIIILQRCSKPEIITEKPVVVRDTVWATTQDVVITNPTLIKTIPGKTETNYIPDPDYKNLILQYQKLVENYTAQNIHRDSIKIDSIGYVKIEDTVSHNLITGRKTSYSLKYPIITNTITLPLVRKNQIYYGGGLEYSPMNGQEFNAGILLKTKSDQVYSVYGGLNSNGGYQIGIQSFWKIKLHK